MKRVYGLAAILCFSTALIYAQVDHLTLKAERQIDRGNLREAKIEYQKALEKEPDNRAANQGMGLMLSELLDNYHDALPYLLKANSIATKDSSYDLIFALGKCYHYKGDYESAILFYNRLVGVQDLDDETDFQKELEKRRADCEFALSKKNIPPDENIYIVNAGKAINTEYPEYVPVLSGKNELLFTSKRKDNKKEEINYLDGKYFESMYTARITDRGFTDVKRYALPEKLINSKSYNNHQAVVSISPDNKKLFTFKDSKLYEIPIDGRNKEEPGEVKINKFNHYQNHAFLSRDGSTLYFTSDAAGGYGGTDIYRAKKQADGTWGRPENLGQPVNTAFDEDAPFLSDGGVLYFASEGHEGFGNYDLYRSEFVDGKWTTPENLGQPINSPGHDIFLVNDSASTNAYFSSGRNGGFGDMDIYKIVYLDKMKKDCPVLPNPLIALSASDRDTTDYKNVVEVQMPGNYQLLSASWEIENSAAGANINRLEYDYKQAGTYHVKAKLLLGCDTCLTPIVSCNEFENKLEKVAPVYASNQPQPAGDLAVVGRDGKEKTTTPVKDPKEEKDDKKANAGNPKKNAVDETGANGGDRNLPRKFNGVLSAEQLEEIGFNTNHILFDFNKSTLRADAYAILDTNIRVLKSYPQLYLEVKGYADSRGPKDVNERISKSRAKAVKDYLLKHGAKPKQIKFITGKGSENLTNECGPGVECDEERHQQNRRVEFTVTGDK